MMALADLTAFEKAERSARDQLDLVLEAKRAFRDGEPVVIPIDRLALRHHELGELIQKLPRSHEPEARLIGTIHPSPTRVGGGDATGPDDGSAA